MFEDCKNMFWWGILQVVEQQTKGNHPWHNLVFVMRPPHFYCHTFKIKKFPNCPENASEYISKSHASFKIKVLKDYMLKLICGGNRYMDGALLSFIVFAKPFVSTVAEMTIQGELFALCRYFIEHSELEPVSCRNISGGWSNGSLAISKITASLFWHALLNHL